jgi:hypothetical protein
MNPEAARTLDELYRVVNPDLALTSDDPRYVDLSPARGDEDLVALISRRIRTATPPNYHRRLVTGHRGSGKSTELRRLQASLESHGFLVAYLDVEVTLDLADVEYLDLMLAVAQELDRVARQHGLEVNPDLLQDVSDWFAEVLLTTEERHEAEIALGSEYGAGIQLPLLAKILATVTSKMRSGSTSRREVRQKLERRLVDLLSRVNQLVDNITLRAKAAGHKGLVVIADSMEKIPFKRLDEHGLTNHALLFVEHAEQLKALPCHTVYTVPVSLLNDRNLGIAYSDVDLIPMVKIVTPEREPWEPGRDLLYQVVARRLDVGRLFAEPQIVYRLVEASGGVVRDLMRLTLFAADYTPTDRPIASEAAEKATHKLVREYDRLIHQGDLELLEKVARDVHIAASSDLARLMYNRLVLPFINEDNWVDLHPAVRQAATFRAHLKVARD